MICLFLKKKTQLKFLKNVMGVHKYSVNDAVRADFGIFPSSISGLKASANFLGAPCKLKQEFLSLSTISRQHESS